MGKKRKNRNSGNPILDWIETLKLKDLKRVALMKGLSFRLLGELSIFELQSWVYKHYNEPDNIAKLEEYDNWLEKTLTEEGYIEKPIHIDLKLAFYPEDDEGNSKKVRRDPNIFGVTKSNTEKAYFKPRKGAMKSLVFDLIEKGKPTKEIIKIMDERFPAASIGSVKVWCSQARKREKARKELGLK